MKKIFSNILLVVILVLAASVGGINTIKADTGDIPLDKKHFPDSNLRMILSRKVDRNDDGILQKSEIKRVTHLSVYAPVDKKENTDVVINIKGLGYLKNLEKITIRGEVKFPNNFKFSKFKKLKKFRWDTGKLCNSTLDLSGAKNLENVLINADIKKYKFGKLKKLKKVCLGCNSQRAGKLDLSQVTNLQDLTIFGVELKNIRLGNQKKLKNIGIYHVKFLKELDLTQMEELKNLSVEKCSNLKFIKFNKAAKLKSISIFDCNKLRSLILQKSGNIKSMWICGCKSLKTIDLRNISVEELVYDKTYTKEIK